MSKDSQVQVTSWSYDSTSEESTHWGQSPGPGTVEVWGTEFSQTLHFTPKQAQVMSCPWDFQHWWRPMKGLLSFLPCLPCFHCTHNVITHLTLVLHCFIGSKFTIILPGYSVMLASMNGPPPGAGPVLIRSPHPPTELGEEKSTMKRYEKHLWTMSRERLWECMVGAYLYPPRRDKCLARLVLRMDWSFDFVARSFDSQTARSGLQDARIDHISLWTASFIYIYIFGARKEKQIKHVSNKHQNVCIKHPTEETMAG